MTGPRAADIIRSSKSPAEKCAIRNINRDNKRLNKKAKSIDAPSMIPATVRSDHVMVVPAAHARTPSHHFEKNPPISVRFAHPLIDSLNQGRQGFTGGASDHHVRRSGQFSGHRVDFDNLGAALARYQRELCCRIDSA